MYEDLEATALAAYYRHMERQGAATVMHPAAGSTEVSVDPSGRTVVKFSNVNGPLATVRLRPDGRVHDVR